MSPIVETHFSANRNLWGLVALTAFLLIFFYPLWSSGSVLFFGDLTFITYPLKTVLAAFFQQGQIPYWTPSVHFGTPFLAAFHTGVFYPLNFIFLLGSDPQVFNVFYLLHFLILTVSVFGLCHSWGLSMGAAICSALTAAGGGFFLSTALLSNIFFAVVWLPWIFWGFERFILTRQTRYLVAAIGGLTCQTLAASPEICVLTVGLLLLHVFCVVPRRASIWGAGHRLGFLVLLAAGALGLSALQLVPTYELMGQSVRKGGLTYEQHTFWSMHPLQSLDFILPPDLKGYLTRPHTEFQVQTFFYNIYMGLLTLVVLGLGYWLRKIRQVRFWILIFLAGLFFALGYHNPAYPFLHSVLPFLDLFRYPEKFLFLSVYSGVFLVGFGLDGLVQGLRDRRIGIRPITWLFLTLFALVGLVSTDQGRVFPQESFLVLWFLALGCILFYFKKIQEFHFKTLVILLVAFDLGSLNYSVLPKIERKFYTNPPQLVKYLKSDPGSYRVYTGKIAPPVYKGFPNEPTREAGHRAGREHLYPYSGMQYGLEYPNGIPGIGLELASHREWREFFLRSTLDQRVRILKRSNVKYWVDGDTPTSFSEGRPQMRPDRLKVFGDFLPRAFMVPGYRFMAGDKIMDTYYEASFQPRSEVLLEEKIDFVSSEHFEGRVASIEYSSNKVVLETEQTGNGFLVLLDSWFPGWEVKVDGAPGRILKANHFYRAVQLGSGRHTLEFEFFPLGFQTGIWISTLTLLLLVSGTLAVKWKNKN